ncbi:MAG: DUF2071 domain-containing protein [Gemmatimonadales bacterium]|nr:MAG: DUF2071 domain-containing protein [Gemmatimonadales bacterium]
MFMRWSELAFLHWPVPAALLRPLLPQELTLDTFEGEAWLGIVPFRMEGTRARPAPPIPTATNFPELNVRTYVRGGGPGGGRAGVWFFSLDASSRLAVLGARVGVNLPYFHADMEIEGSLDDGVRFASRRRGAGWPGAAVHLESAALRCTYRAVGDVFHAAPGSLEHWLTERYCLFGRFRSGAVYFMDVHHLPWPLREGRVELEANSVAEAAGIPLHPDIAPLVHVAGSLDVRAWLPVKL